jgi:membrane protein DedA with SNARE-associated domain
METLLEFSGATAYVGVGLLAMAESGLFVGLLVPGETAMILAGVLVARGHAELGWMVIAASAGAIIGDSISYEVGRRFGPRLATTRLGRRVGDQNWCQARDYVGARGGRAVFFGRFLGVLRALVPAVAGWAGMRYRAFLTFNIAGGLIWSTGTILLGVLAGRSWQLVETWVGRISLVGAGLVIAVLFFLVARWSRVQRRGDRAPPGEASSESLCRSRAAGRPLGESNH